MVSLFIAFSAGSLTQYYFNQKYLLNYKAAVDNYSPHYKRQADIATYLFNTCRKHNGKLRKAYRKRTNCI